MNAGRGKPAFGPLEGLGVINDAPQDLVAEGGGGEHRHQRGSVDRNHLGSPSSP